MLPTPREFEAKVAELGLLGVYGERWVRDWREGEEGDLIRRVDYMIFKPGASGGMYVKQMGDEVRTGRTRMNLNWGESRPAEIEVRDDRPWVDRWEELERYGGEGRPGDADPEFWDEVERYLVDVAGAEGTRPNWAGDEDLMEDNIRKGLDVLRQVRALCTGTECLDVDVIHLGDGSLGVDYTDVLDPSLREIWAATTPGIKGWATRPNPKDPVFMAGIDLHKIGEGAPFEFVMGPYLEGRYREAVPCGDIVTTFKECLTLVREKQWLEVETLRKLRQEHLDRLKPEVETQEMGVGVDLI